MLETYDVIVVGAGQAGSVFAYLLAREGYSVLVLEKQPSSWEKPCGGGVTRKAAALIPVPWRETIRDETCGSVFRYRKGINLQWPKTVCFMVARLDFDAALARAAEAAGAVFLRGREVTDVEVGDSGVVVHTRDASFRGMLVAGADGVHSRVARLWRKPGKSAFAVRTLVVPPPERLAEFRGSLAIDFKIIPGGYGWIFPKDDHLNVGIGAFACRHPRPLGDYLKDYLTKEGLTGCKVLQYQGYPVPIGGLEEGPAGLGRVVLLGDAAGLADPLTGEGIYSSLLSAHLAAEAVVSSRRRWETVGEIYQTLLADRLFPELRITRRMAGLFYRGTHFLASFMEKKPGLTSELWEILYVGGYEGLRRRRILGRILRALV